MTVISNQIRFRVDPRGIPPDKAARRLGITLAAFEEKKEALFARGFPRPDLTTGNYDLLAIDVWMNRQQTILANDGLTNAPTARNASEVFGARTRRYLDGAR